MHCGLLSNSNESQLLERPLINFYIGSARVKRSVKRLTPVLSLLPVSTNFHEPGNAAGIKHLKRKKEI